MKTRKVSLIEAIIVTVCLSVLFLIVSFVIKDYYNQYSVEVEGALVGYEKQSGADNNYKFHYIFQYEYNGKYYENMSKMNLDEADTSKIGEKFTLKLNKNNFDDARTESQLKTSEIAYKICFDLCIVLLFIGIIEVLVVVFNKELDKKVE